MQRRPTLEDVAAEAGVSRALVSIVVRGAPGASEATRERVIAVAERMGYRPDARAQLLAGRRTRLLGMVLPLNDPFHAEVAEGVYAAAGPAGYQVVLSAITGSRDEAAAIETLLDYRCEAAVLPGVPASSARLAALAKRLPVVVVGAPSRVRGVSVVHVPDAEGMELAVSHLADLGHRSVVHLDGADAPAAAERREGFAAAAAARELRWAVEACGSDEEHGADAAARLAADRLPTAVVTYNDRIAVGLIDAFLRLGVRVPEDVSVVGYDDTRIARFPYLKLTTVSQDAAQLGRVAVETAIARLDGKRVSRELRLAPHLVVRATTAPPRG